MLWQPWSSRLGLGVSNSARARPRRGMIERLALFRRAAVKDSPRWALTLSFWCPLPCRIVVLHPRGDFKSKTTPINPFIEALPPPPCSASTMTPAWDEEVC